MREFTDPDGTPWKAWSVTPGLHTQPTGRRGTHLPEEMQEGWLCFESATEKRRFSPTPPEWETRSDRELWILCRAAIPAARREGAA